MRNIPHCCLPQESGPCLSPNAAVRPLSPATRRRHGGPSPRRQADGTRARPPPDRSFARRAMRPRGVIGHYPGFPRAIPVWGAGRPRVTRPFAADRRPEGRVTARLACVRRAASVRPEPGSNSPFERHRAGPSGLALCSLSMFSRRTRLDPLRPTGRRGGSSCCLAVSGSQGARLARLVASFRAGRGRTIHDRAAVWPRMLMNLMRT